MLKEFFNKVITPPPYFWRRYAKNLVNSNTIKTQAFPVETGQIFFSLSLSRRG